MSLWLEREGRTEEKVFGGEVEGSEESEGCGCLVGLAVWMRGYTSVSVSHV